MKKELIINCLHCYQLILIIKLNWRIFRCVILKSNVEQINQHLNKNVWDDWSSNNLIYDCGKPFLIDANTKALICD